MLLFGKIIQDPPRSVGTCWNGDSEDWSKTDLPFNAARWASKVITWFRKPVNESQPPFILNTPVFLSGNSTSLGPCNGGVQYERGMGLVWCIYHEPWNSPGSKAMWLFFGDATFWKVNWGQFRLALVVTCGVITSNIFQVLLAAMARNTSYKSVSHPNYGIITPCIAIYKC